MSKPNKKLLETARNYLYSYARFCAWDNHDDMEDSDRWQHTFDFLSKGKTSIENFIKKYLTDEIPKAKNEAVEGYNEADYEGAFDSFDEEFGL
jgi:hypothetical protein